MRHKHGIRVIREKDEIPPSEPANIQIRRFVTPSQARAVEALLRDWNEEELLPGIMDALREKLEIALHSGSRADFSHVIGMVEGLTLIMDDDPRIARIGERAELLSREIGRDDENEDKSDNE